jgi:ubiquinone/menaquinone biosynthesis C-methylase UbiE
MSHATVSHTAAAAAFDRVADSYDEVFTQSAIGQAQRKQVWPRLLSAFAPGQRVLELNCGTGEDARFLTERERTVVACDASLAMIEVARRGVWAESGLRNLRFVNLGNEDLDLMPRRPQFDGAFSNFSGLNCVADLKPVAANLAELVRPGGNVLLCLWSRVCVSEFLWYSVHGQLKKACRRLPGKAMARVGDLSIPVSYPTVSKVRQAFAPWFELHARRAVGLFVPPSYIEPWLRNRKKTLSLMEQLDRHCTEWPLFRAIGDHVLLEFTRCNR